MMSDDHKHASVAVAIPADVATRMPTLAEITSSLAGGADPTDIGPDVTLSVVHMHILTQ